MRTFSWLECGRWNARVTKSATSEAENRETRFEVEVLFRYKPFSKFAFSEPLRPLYEPWYGSDPGAVRLFAEHLGYRVTKADMANLRHLEHAAHTLCLHLLDGGTGPGWCRKLRLEPIHKWELSRKSFGKVLPLLIHLGGKMFVLPAGSLCGFPLLKPCCGEVK